MNLNLKFHIVTDKTKTSQYIKKNILKKISKHKLSKSNRIMVIGGDGFMLNSLKKYLLIALSVFPIITFFLLFCFLVVFVYPF